MTGFGERTARTLLFHLIETGFVTSTGHVVPVRFAFPLDALHFCRPSFTRKRLVAKTEHGRGHAPAVGYRRQVLRKSEPNHFCLIRLAICIRNLRIIWQ